MLTAKQLREVFDQYDFAPLKRYGENYLVDANIKDKIIEAAGLVSGEVVLEIGPGLGALTIDLAQSGAKVYAVEKDKKAFAILMDLVGSKYPDLTLIQGDILEFDPATIGSSKKIKVIGNLPYYITSPIIEYIITNRSRLDCAIIMVQREVANRILAAPGTKDYGSLSCFVQYYTKPTYLHTITHTAYYPPPDVDSSLIKLEILAKPSVSVRDEELFFKIMRGAFNQRRKTILNSLSRPAVLDMPKEKLTQFLAHAGIDPSARPEKLGLPEFARLANALTGTDN